jgi:squalene-hopene/tetraprenyl-beta-curcumene cyclase
MAASGLGDLRRPRGAEESMLRPGRVAVVAACVVGLWTGLPVQESRGELPAQTRRVYEETVARATNFLITKGQAEDGSFSKEAGPAVTSLVVTALLRSGRQPDDPAVQRGLAYIESFIQEDGGIYQPGSLYQNYETCLALMCFAEVQPASRYQQQIRRADAFVKRIQWDESEDLDRSDFRFGGAGYGNSARPDLSNTRFLINALRASGNAEDDPALQAALLFVSRCQNLESEHNTTPFPAKNPDGGFYYTAAAGGQSQAGTTDNGGLRSYASMTYAGLKSMIFAGVGADDPRVKAAYDWARKNYDLSTNPGMGSSGLYYYYHTFAKALSAMKVDVVKDAQGVEHDWRSELIHELARRQQADGSWKNENERWLEGDPNLVTAYALLSLSYCAPQ